MLFRPGSNSITQVFHSSRHWATQDAFKLPFPEFTPKHVTIDWPYPLFFPHFLWNAKRNSLPHFSQGIRICFLLRMVPSWCDSAMYFPGLFQGWWTWAAQGTTVKAEVMNHELWEEQVESRENKWWIPQIKRFMVDIHCLLNVSCQETTPPTPPTTGALPRYQKNAQELRKTRIDLCSLLYQ